jgi:vitamin B12 transporter
MGYRNTLNTVFGIVVVAALACPPSLVAQSDTVMLDRFMVWGTQRSDIRDFSNQPLDTVHLQKGRTGSLADLLSQTSPVTMRYYGPGQLASAGFRGAAASQTVVVWNGIRINNPMMMQTDLATIPVQLISSGSLAFGSGTLEHASGAFGGVVTLESQPATADVDLVSFNASAGSFGFFSGNTSLSIHSDKLMLQTSLYHQSAGNAFPYPDNFSGIRPYPVEMRENAGYSQQGVVQQLHYAGVKGWQYQAGLWYQDNDRDVPYPIHQPQGKYIQKQEDKDLRLIFTASSRIGKRAKMALKAGYQEGMMHFIDERSATDATHLTRNLQLGASTDGRCQGWLWRTQGEYEMQEVNSDAYQGTVRRHIPAFYGELIRDKGRRFNYGLTGRMEMVNMEAFELMPAVMAGYHSGKSRAHFLRLMVMRNRQLPGMNDLYWIPGGNPQLKPEYGPAFEFGYEKKPFMIGNVTSSASVVLYYQQIANKIKWMPDSTTLWSAVNIGEVKMQGLEAQFRSMWKWHDAVFDATARLNFTSATRMTNQNSGRDLQLMYQPLLASTFALTAHTRLFFLSLENTITGKQFTNVDNTAWLPPFALTHLRIRARTFEMRFIDLHGNLNLNNILNKHYQAIAWYPIPGRTIHAGININIKQKNI